MSNRGEGADIGSTPDRKPAAAQSSSTIQPSGPSTEAAQDQLSSLSLADKPTTTSKGPLTPSTLETKPTGSSSVDSSEQDRDETNAPNSESPRQTIAVSVSKGPSAFFNLARKFLVTDETCDLSALEGAIVSAIDAAHLLERSKIATITRLQTSYVAVEPKKKKDRAASTGDQPTSHGSLPTPAESAAPTAAAAAAASSRNDRSQPLAMDSPSVTEQQNLPEGTLRRSRIVITVKRTDAYVQWLKENPIQDIHSGDDDDRI
mmetsp:Transcript_13355/g.21956  ORF Transcript_13355/g.21956 Transcript_13355/m.21956 type:complete len:261 (-) Transcript_13355:470-1252(-)